MAERKQNNHPDKEGRIRCVHKQYSSVVAHRLTVSLENSGGYVRGNDNLYRAVKPRIDEVQNNWETLRALSVDRRLLTISDSQVVASWSKKTDISGESRNFRQRSKR